MKAGKIFRHDAQTFLIHLFGRGLEDDRYVIERYKSLANGEIRPVRAERPKAKGRQRQRRTVATLSAVKKLRPERDEIIVCTGVKLARSGVQIWGVQATGLAASRHAR